MHSFFRLSMIMALLGLAGLTPSALAAESVTSVRSAIAQIQQRLVSLSSKSPFENRLFTFSSGPAGQKSDPDNCTVPTGWDVQKVWFQDQPGTDLTPVTPHGAEKALDWQHLADYIQSFNFAQPPLKHARAAIIIVDDFATLLKYSNQSLPGVGGRPGPLTHGGLIQAQIEEVLRMSGFGDSVQVFNVPFNAGEKTSALNARIERQIGSLTRQKYTHIVVNMSFVVMSCGVVNDYKKWISGNNHKNTRIDMQTYIDELWTAYRKIYGGNSVPTELFMAAVLSANVIADLTRWRKQIFE